MLAPRTCAAPAGGRAPPSRCSTSASSSGNTSASASARPNSSDSASPNPNASASANPRVNDSARVDIGHRKALAQSQPLWQHEELETSDARDRCGRGPPALRQLRVVVPEKEQCNCIAVCQAEPLARRSILPGLFAPAAAGATGVQKAYVQLDELLAPHELWDWVQASDAFDCVRDGNSMVVSWAASSAASGATSSADHAPAMLALEDA